MRLGKIEIGGQLFAKSINLFVVTILMSSVVAAKTPSKKEKSKPTTSTYKLLLDLEFKKKSGEAHTYKIIEDNSKKQTEYLLTFVNENKALKSLKLDKSTSELIQAEALQIIWEQNYKAKAKEICNVYATVKLEKQTTKVCNENLQIVGRTQALLYRLNNLF